MKRKIDRLYEYCKLKGYNESKEKFEEDLSQLIVEELENEELLNVSGGKKGINAVTAGLISALSVASPMVSAQQVHFFDGNKVMTPVSDTTKVNQGSHKKTIDSMKSKINLKNILLGVGGVSILGNAVLAGELIRSKCGFKNGNCEKITEICVNLAENYRKQLDKFYSNLDETNKYAFLGKLSGDSYSLLEKMFIKFNGEGEAQCIKLQTFIESCISKALSGNDTTQQIAENLKTTIKKQTPFTLGGEPYIPIGVLWNVRKNLFDKTLNPYFDTFNKQRKNFDDKVCKDFNKAKKSPDFFYNGYYNRWCSCEDKVFKMFLDVCCEFLKGCPEEDLNPSFKFYPYEVSNFRGHCLSFVDEAMKKNGSVSAESIVKNLKNGCHFGLKYLEDKEIELDNANEDVKWNVVGAIMLSAYFDFEYVNSRLSDNAKKLVKKCHETIMSKRR